MPLCLPPCPHLPVPPAQMAASALSAHGFARDGAFYLTALTYGHFLWQNGQAARAILKLDRALLADLRGDEPVLRDWPLPYEAMTWFLRHTPPDVFIGNPRVHFQHLADRMNEPRREQRRWRTWACWALCRSVRPEFPPDPLHQVVEPARELIAEKLTTHGIAGETDLWLQVLIKTALPNH